MVPILTDEKYCKRQKIDLAIMEGGAEGQIFNFNYIIQVSKHLLSKRSKRTIH